MFVFVFVFANRRERRLQTGPVCKRLYVFVFANPTNKRQTLESVRVAWCDFDITGDPIGLPYSLDV